MQPVLGDSSSSTLDANNDQSPSLSKQTPADDNRFVRSIPPWVHLSTEEDEDDHHINNATDQRRRLLPPAAAVPASHHYAPEPPTQHKAPGRKWDHLRDAEPALIDQAMEANQERWLPYMLSGPHPRGVEGARLVSDEWMEENMPYLSQPWESQNQHEESEKARGFWLLSSERRAQTFGRITRFVMKNPFAPLVFRLTVLAFTLAALGLGARVFHEADNVSEELGGCNKRASTYMAIILDSIAVPYIGYITWDEYLSKPLGLRSATAKVSLLLIDLYFIVFYSSNLSLAIDALNDPRWACYEEGPNAVSNCPKSHTICSSQKGLSGVLVVALVAWLMTFMISVLRVVDRLR